MKKLLENKFAWLLAIVGISVAIWYMSTWQNKNWLIDEIIKKGGAENTEEIRKTLALKSASQLRDQLKSLA